MIEKERYKKQLDDEQATLERELESLGVKYADREDDWELKAPKIEVMTADENELADRTEEEHIDSIVLDELEARYRSVRLAQRKLADGTYGTCDVCDEPISEERLDANPAAATCKEHMGQESTPSS